MFYSNNSKYVYIFTELLKINSSRCTRHNSIVHVFHHFIFLLLRIQNRRRTSEIRYLCVIKIYIFVFTLSKNTRYFHESKSFIEFVFETSNFNEHLKYSKVIQSRVFQFKYCLAEIDGNVLVERISLRRPSFCVSV